MEAVLLFLMEDWDGVKETLTILMTKIIFINTYIFQLDAQFLR